MDFNRRASLFLIIVVALISCGNSQSYSTNNVYNGNGNGQGYGLDVACGVCPAGFQREQSYGPYCGRCVPETTSCKQGSYLDGSTCVGCPCQGPERATGCQKDGSGQVNCQCTANYAGRACEQCAPGCVQRDFYPYDCYQPGESQICQGQGCSSQTCTGSSCSSSMCTGNNCQSPCVGSNCPCQGLSCRQPPPPLCDGCGCRGNNCACDSCHFDRHQSNQHHHYHHTHIYQCNETVPACPNCTVQPSPTCRPVVINQFYNTTNINNAPVTFNNYTNVTEQNIFVKPPVCEECICDPRGTVRQAGSICVCKDNVEGASCSRCKDGHFSLNLDNPEGCTSCFCSGLSSQCSLKNFFHDFIVLRRPHGVQLTDRIENLFQIGNDMTFTYDDASRKDLYWYLPHYFLGTRITSYGGKLIAKRKFTTKGGSASSTINTDVIIISSYGTSIYWASPDVFAGGVASQLEVTLDDRSGWIIDRHNFSSIASRNDIMEVLSDVQKILIRATLADKNRMESTSLSDVSLSTGTTDSVTEQGLALAIEGCNCPSGYQGFSCESCSPGYYRDFTDMTRGVFGACKRCPCGRNSNGCYLENMDVVCICKEGYSGPKCTACESLSVSVNPIKCQDCYDALVSFTCSYVTTRTDLSVEFSTIPPWQSLLNHPAVLKKGVLFPDRSMGNSITATIPLLRKLNKVICTLKESRTGEIVAEARSTVIGQECDPPSGWISPGFFDATPEFLCINTTQTATFRCHASTPVTWYRERPWARVRSTPDGYLKFDNDDLYANRVTVEGSGTYACVGQNGNSVFTKKVMLLIRNGTECYTNNHKQGVVPGGTFEMRRSESVVTEEPWGEQNSYKNDVISVKPATSDNNGIDDSDDDYEWNDSPRDHVTTTTTADYKGDLDGLPRVYVYPTIQRVPVGQQARFKCTPSSESIRVFWQAESGEIFDTPDGMLNFPVVSKADEKNYICVGINSAGKSLAKSSLIVVDSTFGLIVSSSPPAHLAQIDQQIVFSCESRDRVIQIDWQREGGRLPPNAIKYPNGSLVISSVKLTDSGVYICSGLSNSGETTTGKLLLTVKQTPNVTLIPPHVSIRPSTNPLMVSPGENVRIHCHATGEPTPRLTWSRSMTSPGGVGGFERKLVEVQSLSVQYELTDVSIDDSGNYTCTGRSAAGVHHATILVSVTNRGSQRRHHRQRN